MMLLARLGCSQGHWDPDPTAWGQRAARLNPTPEAELARPRHPELAEQTPTVSPSPVDTLLWWACRWAARRVAGGCGGRAGQPIWSASLRYSAWSWV